MMVIVEAASGTMAQWSPKSLSPPGTQCCLQNASCISLHASGLSFDRIEVRLVVGEWEDAAAAAPKTDQTGGGGAPAGPVCLCGPASSTSSSSSGACLTSECGRLFKAHPGAAADTKWLLSLGPLMAPAGSTLLLSAFYSAAVSKGGQGLWRSSSFPAASSSSSGQQQQQQQHHVVLSTEFEMNAARSVLPCMDEPGLKVRAHVWVGEWVCARQERGCWAAWHAPPSPCCRATAATCVAAAMLSRPVLPGRLRLLCRCWRLQAWRCCPT